jgi:hypothetical protein
MSNGAMTWDAHHGADPVADIRRSLEAQRERAIGDAEADRNAHTRYTALLGLARRQDSGEAQVAIEAAGDLAGNVWLADEHGLLSLGFWPVVVPRSIAIGLGATFGKLDGMPGEVATVRTGVLAEPLKG